jgi:hypothetical protein
MAKYPDFDQTQNCYALGVDFFYEDKQPNRNTKLIHQEQLRKMCGTCKFLEACREYAIYHEYHGFWGGMTEYERITFRKQHKIIVQTPEAYSNFVVKPRGSKANVSV